MAANCQEMYTIVGPLYGIREGFIMIVKKVPNRPKSSGAAFRAHTLEKLSNISILATKADPSLDLHIGKTKWFH